jgi:hypothetical protein
VADFEKPKQSCIYVFERSGSAAGVSGTERQVVFSRSNGRCVRNGKDFSFKPAFAGASSCQMYGLFKMKNAGAQRKGPCGSFAVFAAGGPVLFCVRFFGIGIFVWILDQYLFIRGPYSVC